MSEYAIKFSDGYVILSGLSFKDKKMYKNKNVTAEEYYIRAEDVNAIKKSVNGICEALRDFSDSTVNDINNVIDLSNTATERALELSRDCSTLSR